MNRDAAGERGFSLDEDGAGDGESMEAYESNQPSQSLKLESESKSLGRGAYRLGAVLNGRKSKTTEEEVFDEERLIRRG